MATSGSVDSGGYQGRVLRFEWGTNSISAERNVRNIWYKVTAVGGSSSRYYHHNETVEINGQNVYSGDDSHSVTTGDVLASGNLDINQSNTTSLTVKMHGGIYVRSDNIDKEQSWALDTIPRYLSITEFKVNSKGLNEVEIYWKVSDPRSSTHYSLNGGDWIGSATYSENVASDGKSGTFKIKNLQPNTTYKLKIKCTRSDSGLSTESNEISFTTYDIARISTASNFKHGDGTSIQITNPAALTLSLEMKIVSNSILTKTVVTGTNSISFSDNELDKIYKLYGNSNSLTVTFIVSGGGYTNSKTCTVTLAGNQKTSFLKVNNSIKRAKIFVCVNGQIKRAVAWICQNGKIKRCG